jgi:hypothetical protein
VSEFWAMGIYLFIRIRPLSAQLLYLSLPFTSGRVNHFYLLPEMCFGEEFENILSLSRLSLSFFIAAELANDSRDVCDRFHSPTAFDSSNLIDHADLRNLISKVAAQRRIFDK